MSENPSVPPKIFAVQLRRIGVSEIAFSCLSFGKANVSFAAQIDLTNGVGPYDSTAQTIQVFVTAASHHPEAAPGEQAKAPPSFRVTVVGEFHVSDLAVLPFPLEKLPIWASRNGAAVLMPFLRAQVHALTKNSGFGPVLIPMLEVLPFKVEPPDISGEAIVTGAILTSGAPRESSPAASPKD